MADADRGKVNVKVFCERDESLSGRPRDSGPDIGFHEIGGKGGTKDCNLIFL